MNSLLWDLLLIDGTNQVHTNTVPKRAMYLGKKMQVGIFVSYDSAIAIYLTLGCHERLLTRLI